jgi:hypothetical protein
MKKVTEKNLRVNDIIYKQENASELFEIEALQDGIGMMISISSAIEDYKPIDSSIFGNLNGENWVFATEQEIKNNRKNEMITDNFKVFIEALEALPEDIKNNEVNMKSVDEPVCGTVGCFAGLVSIVANEIPELKELYSPDIPNYDYVEWSNALNVFLGCRFTNWAGRNKVAWGNSEGRRMFSDITAFGKERWDVLNHNDIIVFLRGVYERWIEKIDYETGEIL